jgi:hypothetical protein
MSSQNFLDRAIAAVSKAIELDNAGECEKAYQGYYGAREWNMSTPSPYSMLTHYSS